MESVVYLRSWKVSSFLGIPSPHLDIQLCSNSVARWSPHPSLVSISFLLSFLFHVSTSHHAHTTMVIGLTILRRLCLCTYLIIFCLLSMTSLNGDDSHSTRQAWSGLADPESASQSTLILTWPTWGFLCKMLRQCQFISHFQAGVYFIEQSHAYLRFNHSIWLAILLNSSSSYHIQVLLPTSQSSAQR